LRQQLKKPSEQTVLRYKCTKLQVYAATVTSLTPSLELSLADFFPYLSAEVY